MKKLILTLLLALTTLTVSANSVRYFTRHQAARVAATLDAQSELMIYCGYEYELATYVIVNEVWAEPVNSKYYEIWLFGFDAYTGEEIYMPIDLACIWLFNPAGNRMYSAAQYLRFRTTVAMPNFYWTMPPYNAYVRHFHDPMFNHCHTYHYEIHRHGWRPPMPPAGGPWPYHPYYMRTPQTPAPVPTKPFTPGVDHPQTTDGHNYIPNANRGSNNVGTRSSALSSRGAERTGSVRNNSGNPGTTNRNSSTQTTTERSNVTNSARGASNTDRKNDGSKNDRGTNANSSRGNTNNSRGTNTDNSRGTTTNTRGTNTDNTRGTTTNTRGTTTNTRGTTTNTRGTTTTTTRSTTTTNSRETTSSNGRGTSTTTTGRSSNEKKSEPATKTTTSSERSSSTPASRSNASSSSTGRGTATTSRENNTGRGTTTNDNQRSGRTGRN